MTVDANTELAARGHTAPGFEAVAAALERSAAERGETGCAVSAYVDGARVVDLWWGTADGKPWAEDTLVTVMSCTKGALTLCAHILYDRGLLDLDAPVTRYWPEYGAAGKEGTLVRHLLSHTAGVLTFPDYWEDIGIDGHGLADWELMTSRLAAAPPSWEPGSFCLYHALSIGYLVGEVIRRIDGRTPGRFFAEEVAQPLGLDFHIGTPEDVLPRVAATLPAPPVDLDALTPEQRQGRETFRLLTEGARAAVRAGDATSLQALLWSSGFIHPDRELDPSFLAALMNQPWLRKAELPAGNGTTTARDLARMYAVLAQGGELDGVRLVSPESIKRFATDEADMVGMYVQCVGYHRLFPAFTEAGASASSFGHAGAGGNLGFADPERRLSFGFVKNRMRDEPEGAALDLVRSIYACL